MFDQLLKQFQLYLYYIIINLIYIKVFLKYFNISFIKFTYIFHKTALHIACEKNNAEIVQLLLENLSTDVNIFLEIL